MSWFHRSPIPVHPTEADLDCSALVYPARFAVAGDFDGDGRDEIAVAPNAQGTPGNDFWVMQFEAGTWLHMSPIPSHGMEADFDCSGLDYAARLAVAGDFDGDGRDEIAIGPDAQGTSGNDFWVMDFNPVTGRWAHLSQIPEHGMEADFDCSGLDYAARFAVAGDFDGDGRDEIAIAPNVAGTSGNDFWVMDFNPATRSWSHLSQIPGHGMEADFDCSGLDYAAVFAVAGDFDGDGREEIAVAPNAAGTSGNDFWVMDFDPAAGTWSHLSPIPGHPMEADFDCSGLDYAAWRVVAGDFDGDDREEIAVAPFVGGTSGNDFWVMDFDPTTVSWSHLSPIPGHPMEADFDCSGLDYGTWFAAVGDFDGDDRDEIVVAPGGGDLVDTTEGNDFWVMDFNPATGAWAHMSQIPGHGMEADFDCSALPISSAFAVVGEFGRPVPFVGLWPESVAVAPFASGTRGNNFWVMSPPACIRLHVKVLTAPTIPIATMIANMNQVYATQDLRVVLASTENLNLPLLNVLQVGVCQVTPQVAQLFANRNGVERGDIVVYFVQATINAFNGCAAFPRGRPGAVVAQIASPWTLAHEIGHVLGLSHIDDPPPPPAPPPPRNLDRLMTGGSTSNITNPPPDLIDSEGVTMRSSFLTGRC